jgi:hypothetical protein
MLSILVIATPSTVSASPTISITSPSANGYFLQYSVANPYPYTFRAQITSSYTITSVKLYEWARQSAANNTWVEYYICDLTREGTSNYYSNTVRFSTWYYPLLSLNPLYVMTPDFRIKATDQTGTTVASVTGAVCKCNYATYRNIDSTFSYSSYNYGSNNFRGILTGQYGSPDYVPQTWTYNCMAYALYQSYQGWLWPWNGSLPTDSQLITTMASYGYNTYSYSPLSGTKVIYYSGGHFSRVQNWNSSTGMPIDIISKWGGAELIYSPNYNPFTSGGGYGSARLYFK